MTDRSRLAFWPFLLVDLIFIGVGWLIFSNSHRPLTLGEAIALIACVTGGAISFLIPFLQRDATETKQAASDQLTDALKQIQNLEQLVAQLSNASNQLQTAEDQSKQTVEAAKKIADQITGERRAFSELIQKADDTEKGHLRLEVEKLRRSEGDWIQIIIHILDQIFAVHQAALRSGKPGLIEQLGNFQTACREAARRIGLVCLAAEPGEGFDEKVHQLLEVKAVSQGSRIGASLASGYSFQGRMVRRTLVRLQEIISQPENQEAPQSADAQSTEVANPPQKSLF
ncbi:MAG: nucleotide exchange factor GrpE [Verrucomicrobiota bacterium]